MYLLSLLGCVGAVCYIFQSAVEVVVDFLEERMAFI